MGQGQSNEPRAPRSHEELTRELANRFAEKCFTPLELYSLKDNFKSLADHGQHMRYLKEDTFSRFLEIPDVLGASPVVFQMVSYLGSFPFLQDAPAILGLEQMVMVISIMTERYKRVLARGSADRRKLLFRSLAVYDRKLFDMDSKADSRGGADGLSDSVAQEGEDGNAKSHQTGFAVDEVGVEEDEDAPGDEDDDLVLAAFETLDYVEAFKHGDAPTVHGAMIPADNFRKLLMLLLLIAPLEAQQRLSQYSDRTVGSELDRLRETAEHILAAFLDVETSPGIKFHHFDRVIPTCFPYLFNGFNPFFEHFLFSKNLDFSKHKNVDGKASSAPVSTEPAQPLLQDKGSVLDLNTLSQLSFFIPGSSLFRRVRLLYSGADDGFSMGSFESKVFHWRAPTLVLIRGSRLGDVPQGGQESAFASSLPPRRFPHGSKSDQLTFGAYVSQPWRRTNRECFGDGDSVLFQLAPVHDVFPASGTNKDYVAFTRPSVSNPYAGVSFGCPPPASSTKSHRQSGVVSLGAVSLLLDSSFEFGVFTHDYTSRGGAFQSSTNRRFDFQERFEIENLEVWGCGGDAEAKAQAERWAWESREAEARRKINLGTGDLEADRALLEMAGLIGANRSGGSMG